MITHTRHRVDCSRCGKRYREWKFQDNEGNMCPSCTVAILRREVGEYKKSVKLLLCNLNHENALKLNAYPFYKQRIVVDQFIEQKIITFKIEEKWQQRNQKL